jgi:hypothetical protein
LDESRLGHRGRSDRAQALKCRAVISSSAVRGPPRAGIVAFYQADVRSAVTLGEPGSEGTMLGNSSRRGAKKLWSSVTVISVFLSMPSAFVAGASASPGSSWPYRNCRNRR